MFDGRWRHAVDRTTKPVGQVLVRTGITADVLTIFGLVMSVVTAVAVGSGHLVSGSSSSSRPACPTCSTDRWPRRRGRRRYAVPSSTRWPTASPTPSSSAVCRGTWPPITTVRLVLLPFAILAVTSLISYQRAKAELLGLSAKGGLMERAERFIMLGLCFIAGAVSPAAFVPALWVFFGLIVATAIGRFVHVWKEAEGPPPVGAGPRRLATPTWTSRAGRWRAGAKAGRLPLAYLARGACASRRHRVHFVAAPARRPAARVGGGPGAGVSSPADRVASGVPVARPGPRERSRTSARRRRASEPRRRPDHVGWTRPDVPTRPTPTPRPTYLIYRALGTAMQRLPELGPAAAAAARSVGPSASRPCRTARPGPCTRGIVRRVLGAGTERRRGAGLDAAGLSQLRPLLVRGGPAAGRRPRGRRAPA